MPILRTRKAEIDAYEHLSSSHSILPLFELTRSRRTSKDGDGNIKNNIDRIKYLLNNRWFAIDITTTNEYMNRQIGKILADGPNGFDLWAKCIETFENSHIIPSIILDIDNINTVDHELKRLSRFSGYTLLRLPIKDNPLALLELLFSNIHSNTHKTLLVIDGEYIHKDDNKTIIEHKEIFSQVYNNYGSYFFSISYTCSSFPRSVVSSKYGGENYGIFKLLETSLDFKRELPSCGCGTCYSDYATIHPLIYPGGAGGWIPRVDFPLNDQLFYYRFKREFGGYITAAQHVRDDALFLDTDTWGCKEILAAANGTPNGRSPAHWITVRASLHMERQLTRLNSYSGLEL